MTPAHLDHPAIIARSLTKTFLSGEAAVPALRNVSLDIRRGEVTLLRGPSGSGKTTLLSIFGCILSPDGGSLRIGTRNVLGLPEADRASVRLEQIGFIFQGFNLFPTALPKNASRCRTSSAAARSSASRSRAPSSAIR
jgi:putative ABC transport system ATP-binding protein